MEVKRDARFDGAKVAHTLCSDTFEVNAFLSVCELLCKDELVVKKGSMGETSRKRARTSIQGARTY